MSTSAKVAGMADELAETLRRLRESRNLSQGALQQKITKGGGHISTGLGAAESGARNLGVEKIALIALALDLDEDERDELLRAAGHERNEELATTFDRITALEAAVEKLGARLASLEQTLQRTTTRTRR